MVVDNLEAVKQAVEAARRQPPAGEDAAFQYVKKAKIGTPVLVRTPEGRSAFWIVPFLVKGSACGFARVELSREVSQIGIFGSGPDDHASWIDAEFFEKPPSDTLTVIQSRYFGLEITEPFFSYDRSPSKWAWRLEIRKKDEIKSIVFITPHHWYEVEPDKEKTELEG